MNRLTLLRHAKSSWSDPGLADFDRPLNKRGRHDAPLMGRRLAERKVQPDLVLSSPALRARLTAEAVVGQLGNDPKRLIFDPRIYLAGLDELIALLRGIARDQHDILLIGHNPGLTDLANFLVDGKIANLPTCAMFRVELPDSDWSKLDRRKARTLFYDYPKKVSP